MLSIIVAYDKNYGIGINNKLPWKLKDDLKNFQLITKNNYIVMGRKTFDSIGRVLPNRHNIIMTRQKNFYKEQCTIIYDINDIFKISLNQEVFIIGGSEIFKLFIPYVHKLYISKVDNCKKNSNIFFPKWDKNIFKIIKKKYFPKNNKNEFSFNFEIWEKL